MHGNVGDLFIWGGMAALWARTGVTAQPLSIHAVPTERDGLGTLIVPGNGAMHRFFHEWLPDVIIRAARVFDRVIIMPSSFDLTIAEVRSVVASPNVECHVRDTFSWREMRVVPRAAIGPDLALFHPALRDTVPRPHDGSELLVLRTDHATPLRHTPWRPHPRNHDLSAAGTTSDFLVAIDSVDAVVTDRLHVAFVAALRGRRVQFVNPYDNKITATAAFTLGPKGAQLLEQRSVQWLADRGDLVWSSAAH
jgi:exopolysaccharide biosynthesis predicted pyruvyltransferase EpsI